MAPWMRMAGFLGGTDMNTGKKAMIINHFEPVFNW